MNSTIIAIIVVAVVVVIAVAVALALGARKRREQRERQEQARREYGPEYERAVEERGSEKEAESELRERRERVESEVKPLPEESRHRYAEEWEEVERSFVDDPAGALDGADRVVARILEERNFPTDSREEASKGLGVLHSDVVEDFRKAQRVHQEATNAPGGSGGDSGSDSDGENLEKMRQAIQEYRSVYERLTAGK